MVKWTGSPYPDLNVGWVIVSSSNSVLAAYYGPVREFSLPRLDAHSNALGAAAPQPPTFLIIQVRWFLDYGPDRVAPPSTPHSTGI